MLIAYAVNHKIIVAFDKKVIKGKIIVTNSVNNMFIKLIPLIQTDYVQIDIVSNIQEVKLDIYIGDNIYNKKIKFNQNYTL